MYAELQYGTGLSTQNWCVVVGLTLGQQQYFNCLNFRDRPMLGQYQQDNNCVLPTITERWSNQCMLSGTYVVAAMCSSHFIRASPELVATQSNFSEMRKHILDFDCSCVGDSVKTALIMIFCQIGHKTTELPIPNSCCIPIKFINKNGWGRWE